MKTTYYQVVGNGPVMIDFPHGDSVAHRPGQVFEAREDNQSVVRALRTNRLREMSERESSALRNVKTVEMVKPTPGVPAAAKATTPSSKSSSGDKPASGTGK